LVATLQEGEEHEDSKERREGVGERREIVEISIERERRKEAATVS
jgi:hypothetical protein